MVDLNAALCGFTCLNNTWSFSPSDLPLSDLFIGNSQNCNIGGDLLFFQLLEILDKWKMNKFSPSHICFTFRYAISWPLPANVRDSKVVRLNKRNLSESSSFVGRLLNFLYVPNKDIFWLWWVCIKNTCHKRTDFWVLPNWAIFHIIMVGRICWSMWVNCGIFKPHSKKIC